MAYYSLEVELGYLGVTSLDDLTILQLRDMVIDLRKMNDHWSSILDEATSVT